MTKTEAVAKIRQLFADAVSKMTDDEVLDLTHGNFSPEVAPLMDEIDRIHKFADKNFR